jgi:hypothetical protein
MAIPTEEMITEWKLDMKGNAKQIQDYVKEMKKAERVERAVEHATKRAAGEIDKFGRKVKKAGGDAKGAAKNIESMKDGMTGLKTSTLAVGASIVGLAAGLNSLMSRGNELSKMYDAQAISIDVARESTRGYLSDADLLKAANLSTAFGLGLSAKSFANLAQKATIAAQKIGGDVNQSINDLMVGIARKSKPILDNLGIQMVSLDKIYSDYGVTVGKTTKQLSDSDKTAAFTAATIEGLNKVVGDSKLTVEGASGQWVVFKTELKNANDQVSIAISKNKTLATVLGGVVQLTKEYGRLWRSDTTAEILQNNQNRIKAIREELKFLASDDARRFRDATGQISNIVVRTEEQVTARRIELQKQLTSVVIQEEGQRAFIAMENVKKAASAQNALIAKEAAKLQRTKTAAAKKAGSAKSAGLKFSKSTFGSTGPSPDFISNIIKAEKASSLLAANVQKAMNAAASLPVSNIPLIRMMDEEQNQRAQQTKAQFDSIKMRMDAMAASGNTATAAYRALAAQLTVVGQATIGAANKVTAFRQSIIDTSEDIGGMGKAAFSSFATALFNVADAAEASGESIETEILKALASTLKALAIEAGIKAIFSLAEYAASGFTDVTKLAAAGLYTAVAVAAGAAGAGVGAAAGASSSSGSTAATTSTSSKPTQFAQTVEDKRPVNINVFFNDPFDPSSSFVRQKQVTTAIGRSQTVSG